MGKIPVFIDESGFAHDMPRTYGYALKGLRCFGKHDWHAKGRTNVIGALVSHHLLTVSLFSGSINANIFFAWVTQDLIPKLSQKHIVIMDNASFHKRKDIKNAFEQAEITLLYLPAYSPDLNPIEHKWAQAKAFRKRYQCSIPELFTQYNL